MEFEQDYAYQESENTQEVAEPVEDMQTEGVDTEGYEAEETDTEEQTEEKSQQSAEQNAHYAEMRRQQEREMLMRQAYEQEAWKDAQVLPIVKEACMSTQFSHIFAGGYSAGYYSYKWADVPAFRPYVFLKGVSNRNRCPD